MLRLFPSRIELAPRDIFEATDRLRHRREARRSRISAQKSMIRTRICETNIAGDTYAFPLPPSGSLNQLASYPSHQPHSLQPQSYAGAFQDSRRVGPRQHPQDLVSASSQLEKGTTAPYDAGNFSRSTASLGLNMDQQSAEQEYSYGAQLFHPASTMVSGQNQSPEEHKTTSSVRRFRTSRFFDGIEDDMGLLETFSESLDLNSASPGSTTRGRRSQAPEPSDGQLSEFEASGEVSSPVLPFLPRSVEVYRLMSRETLPRSPLYISEAVISSSPEKPMTRRGSHENSHNTETLPTSRLRGYRLRSGSYTRSSSDLGERGSSEADNEKMSFGAPSSAAPSEEYDGASVVHHSPPPIDSSSDIQYDNLRTASFGQSHRFSPPRFEEIFPASSPPSILREPSVQPPSTPRYLAYPARRPRRQTGEHASPISSAALNSHPSLRRYSASPTPPPPGTPFRSIQVYNDQISPSSQPQTPRNRHAGPFDPALTAPARPGGPIDSRWMWQGGRRRRPNPPGSPGQETAWEEEQENASVEGEWNRLVQRLMNRSGVMRRVNSWIRREGAEELDRTPPAENFRWY
jgi:hypothetical protein